MTTPTPAREPVQCLPVRPGPLRTRSLRRRVTLAVLSFLAVMLVILAVTTDLVLSTRLEGQLEQRLSDRASIAQALVDQVAPRDLVDRLEGDGVSVQLVTAEGERFAKGPLSTVMSSQPPAGPRQKGPGGPAGRKVDPVSRTGDLLMVESTLSDGSRLTLTADAADVRRTLDQVRLALLVGGIAVLGLAAVVLRPIVRRVLRPLDQITAAAESIANGDRGRRLRPDRPDTELGRTAAAFDSMLDSVEGAEANARGAEERLRIFVSDAGHELRTPITGVLAAAERLLTSAPNRAESEQLSVTVIRETRRAARLIDDMLTTAQIDQGLELRPSEVDLSSWAAAVLATKRLTHPTATLELVSSPVQVTADPDRLAQVLGNLLDNAVTAAGRHGIVTTRIFAAGDSAVVEVSDNGPGVPADSADRIFERLVRLDAARTSDTGGSGLGLTIARGIARAHGGELVCLPRPPAGGGCFQLRLPLGSADRSPEVGSAG